MSVYVLLLTFTFKDVSLEKQTTAKVEKLHAAQLKQQKD